MPSYVANPNKVVVKFRCLACDHRYKRTLASIDAPDEPCPKCAVAPRPKPIFNFDGPPPGHIGANNAVRARDHTESIVAADCGLSNLNTNTREGDMMAPRLDPVRQGLADTFFSGSGSIPGAATNPLVAARMQAASVGALNGSLAPRGEDNIVERVHKSKYRVPVHIVAEG